MAARLEPGTTIGGVYRIVRPLSAGGMGAVYVAEQTSTKRERALKVMLPELVASPRLRERFVQEAQIGARIPSEHVVEVLDAGVDEPTGTPWLAMELLEGETLTARCEREGPLSWSLVRELFAQLGHALAAAHDAGIVHRDLKPDNLFLAKARRAAVPYTLKVLDFGIAKLLVEAGTRSTSALGTPLYMPPEQMIPGRPLTQAADVWAMGLIAFYALTNKSYWLSASSETASSMMLLNEVANMPIVPATQRLTELGGSVLLLPPGFDAWFARCVDRAAERRFASARELCAALSPLLAGGGSQTQEQAPWSAPTLAARGPTDHALGAPPTHATPALPTARARPVWASVGIVAGVVGVAGLAVGGYLVGRGSTQTAAGEASTEPVASTAVVASAGSSTPAGPASATPSTSITSPSGSASASASTSAFELVYTGPDSTGVPACDELISYWTRCNRGSASALKTMADDYRKTAKEGPDKVALLKSTCSEMLANFKTKLSPSCK